MQKRERKEEEEEERGLTGRRCPDEAPLFFHGQCWAPAATKNARRWRARINQSGVKINCKTLASRVQPRPSLPYVALSPFPLVRPRMPFVSLRYPHRRERESERATVLLCVTPNVRLARASLCPECVSVRARSRNVCGIREREGGGGLKGQERETGGGGGSRR